MTRYSVITITAMRYTSSLCFLGASAIEYLMFLQSSENCLYPLTLPSETKKDRIQDKTMEG